MEARYVESKISKHLHAKAAKAAIPLSGTFELTPCCNLSCKMCYVRKSMQQVNAEGGLLGAQEWISIAEKARDRGMLYLLLTGGEPLSRPDFREIYTAVRNMGLVVSVNTNGTLIDEDTARFFAANPPSRINMTLYGASRETYAELCGMPDAFDRAINAVRLLTEAGVPLKLNNSVTAHNIGDFEAIYAIAKKFNVHLQTSSYMFPPLRRSSDKIGENDRLSPEEDAAFSLKAEKMRMSDEEFSRRCRARLSGVALEPENECMDAPTEHIGCRAGSTAFWINWNGDMCGCGMIPKASANVTQVGFDKAWDCVRQDMQSVLLPAKCTRCDRRSSCMVCAASCYCETGAFDAVPEYLCRRTNAIVDICRKELENES